MDKIKFFDRKEGDKVIGAICNDSNTIIRIFSLSIYKININVNLGYEVWVVLSSPELYGSYFTVSIKPTDTVAFSNYGEGKLVVWFDAKQAFGDILENYNILDFQGALKVMEEYEKKEIW